MIKKVMLSGKLARAKLLKGATKVGDYVGATLGPKGRNGIIYSPYHAPKITNDGVTIARSIVLDDEIEDLGAQSVVESAMKTNERAGDGTTTTAVIAVKLISDCAAAIEKSESATMDGVKKADVVGMSKEILDARDVVIAKLKEMAKPIKKGDLKNIVATSLGKVYPQFVDMVADIVEKVGVDGYVSVEDNFGTKYGIDSVLSLGMRFLGSYADPLMTAESIKNGTLVMNRNREAIWADVPILVTNHRIETAEIMQNLVKANRAAGRRKLVIICEGYDPSTIRGMLTGLIDSINGGDSTRVLAVKAPSLTTDQFEDLAAYCGARFINKNLQDGDLKFVGADALGHARKIVVDDNDTRIEGAKGNADERIALLKSEIENEKDPSFKEQAKRRLGALQSGFAVIRVGAATEPERDYIKYKIEDAANSAKSALEEGVVRGGGLALQAIAEELGKTSIVYGALCEPHERIKANAGGEIKVPANILDPVKVTRLAVENAFSVASQLITAEVAIASRRRTLMDEFENMLAPRDNEDFRDEENQNVKYMA